MKVGRGTNAMVKTRLSLHYFNKWCDPTESNTTLRTRAGDAEEVIWLRKKPLGVRDPTTMA